MGSLTYSVKVRHVLGLGRFAWRRCSNPPCPPHSTLSSPKSTLSSPCPPHSTLSSPRPPHSTLSSPCSPHGTLSSPCPPHSTLSSPRPPKSTLSSPRPPHGTLSSPHPLHSTLSSPRPPHTPRSSTPLRAVHWCVPTRTFSGSAHKQKSKTHNPDQEDHRDEDDEDFMEDEEVEELFQQQRPAGIGEEDHRVFIVHPDVKWGQKKQYLTTADLQMAEAVGLVRTLQNWTVVDKIIISTKTPEKKRIFGKGNFQMLTEKIRSRPGVSAVFMNIERLSPASEKDLQEAWGVKVFDRYSLVLHIFRRNARTKEAKLQISLAEIPLLRSRLRNEVANLDQQGGGSRYIMGSGETLYEVQQRLLKEREMKIRSALERLRKKRNMLRTQRKHKDFPIVSVMGYTNCGKTTLIKALTGDVALQPKDQLFATLDVTVHAGRLPGHMTVLYVDTIGFLSQLPHQLIDSFSATLDDVAHSDLIVHVRDISHPETVNQKVNVLNVLKNLQIPERLLSSIIEVHNKTDLVESYESPDPEAVPISALKELGLDELKQRVEESVMKSMGKQTMVLKVDLNSPQLGWLYKEATVQEVHDGDDDCTANVKVVISAAAYGRYRKLFQLT